MVIYFCYGLIVAYHNPEYSAFWPDYEFSDTIGSLQPQFGNTIAVGIALNALHGKVRVQFNMFNVTS